MAKCTVLLLLCFIGLAGVANEAPTSMSFPKYSGRWLLQPHGSRQRISCPVRMREMPECQYESTYAQDKYVLKLLLMQSKELYRLQKVTVLRNLAQWFYWQMFGSKSSRFPTLTQLLLTVMFVVVVYIADESFRSYVNEGITKFLDDMWTEIAANINAFFSWCNPLLLCAATVVVNPYSSGLQFRIVELVIFLAVLNFHMPTTSLCRMLSFTLAHLLAPESIMSFLCLVWPMFPPQCCRLYLKDDVMESHPLPTFQNLDLHFCLVL